MQVLKGRVTRINLMSVSPDSRYVVAGGYGCDIWDLEIPKAKPRDLVAKESMTWVPQLRFTLDALFALRLMTWTRFGLTDDTAVDFTSLQLEQPQRGIVDTANGLLKSVNPIDGRPGRSVHEIVTFKLGGEELGQAVSVNPVAGCPWINGFDPRGNRYLGDYGGSRSSLHASVLFDAATDAVVATFERHHKWVSPNRSLPARPWCFTPDGRRVIAPTETYLFVYDCALGGLPTTACSLPTGAELRALAIHPDGRILATVENEREVTFRDAETLQVMRTYDFAMPKVTCVAFTPDGTRCVVGNSRGKVLLFDVE